MEKYKLFLVKANSNRKYFLIDIPMEDGLRTHRYYFLVYSSDEDYKYFRVKNVDYLLHLLQQNNLEIVDTDNMEVTDAYIKNMDQYNFDLEKKITESSGKIISELEAYDTKVLSKLFLIDSFEKQRRNNLK